jgi:two-component system LytT family sensor kinase
LKPITLTKNTPLIPLFLWWLFWTVGQTIIIHRFNFSWQIAAIDATISNLIFALAGFVTQSTYKFYSPGNENRLFRLIYGVALSVICMWLIEFALSSLFSNNQNYLLFLEKSSLIRALFVLLMISFVTIISWLFYYIDEKQKSNQRKSEAEILLRAAELASLRQQLQPHFLFNSLNSISALAGSKPEEARKMIQLLSDFLRGTLKKDDEQIIKLKAEITHLNLYLEIEKVRFGYRLKTKVEVDENCFELELPSLLLQPVVENAIKFGLYNTIEAIEIAIKAYKSTNLLIIEISNPYDHDESPSKKGEGFGLNSLQRRLELVYNRKDLLETIKDNKVFLTRIKIPQ